MTPRVPQAIEVVGKTEQQSLADLRTQTAAWRAGGEFAFHHREDRLHLRSLSILFLRKSAVHLAAQGSSRNTPARLRGNNALRAAALPNVLMVRFGIELGIRQHQTEWRASGRRIH